MIKVDSNVVLTSEVIKYLIDQHKMNELPRLIALDNYYKGQHAILGRTMTDISKPNNKIVNPYAQYITDMYCGYFLGEPVNYSSQDKELIDMFNMVMTYNDEQDENSELGKDASVYGIAYEMLYVDSDAAIRFKRVDPKEVIFIYDNTVESELLYAIRYYDEANILGTELTTRIEVYSKTAIEIYKSGELIDGLIKIDEQLHYFGLVPFVAYKNNDDTIGDFELTISLIDAYDKLASDNLNDFEYFTDSYLGLYGMDADSDDIKNMKENRVLIMPADGKAEWIIKNVNDVQVENLKTRVEQDIHKFSKCPALTDQDFAANASGVAMKYKLMGMENIASVKERKFKKGLQRRIELIANIFALTATAFDWRSIDITFRRNIPANITEIADTINKLRGLVSDSTLLSQIPFIEDTQTEMEKIQSETDATTDIFNTSGSVDNEQVLGTETRTNSN